MLTEQDVLDHINKISKDNDNLSEYTKKYINKLKELEGLQNIQQQELKSLQLKLRRAKDDKQRTRGAISMVLELIAEEEKLIKQNVPNSGDEKQ